MTLFQGNNHVKTYIFPRISIKCFFFHYKDAELLEKKQRKPLDDGTNFCLKFFFRVLPPGGLQIHLQPPIVNSRKSYGLRAVIKRKP